MKRFNAILVIIITLAILISGIYLLESSFFHITNIEVSGDNAILKKDIIDKLEKFKDEPIMYVDTSRLEEEILKDARVLDVNISKRFPSTLEVNINEKKVAAFLKLDKFYAVDDRLNIFNNFNEVDDKNFPIIPNLQTEEEKNVMSKILKQLIVSDMFKISSEIVKQDDYYAIIIQDGTRVYVDEDITKNKLNQSVIVYNQENKINENKAIEYIDLRFDSIIVK